MEIRTQRPEACSAAGAERHQVLKILHDQPRESEKRPCGDCSIRCGCQKRSRTCRCACTVACPSARFELSSERDFPIEPIVLPLVYALSCLRVTPPCWSCEGHWRPSGGVQRLPQVWFYSESPIYAQMVASLLTQLRAEKILNHSWNVQLSPFLNPHGDLSYIIQPQIEPGESVDRAGLDRLQMDLTKLGAFIESRMRDTAATELRNSR